MIHLNFKFSTDHLSLERYSCLTYSSGHTFHFDVLFLPEYLKFNIICHINIRYTNKFIVKREIIKYCLYGSPNFIMIVFSKMVLFFPYNVCNRNWLHVQIIISIFYKMYQSHRKLKYIFTMFTNNNNIDSIDIINVSIELFCQSIFFLVKIEIELPVQNKINLHLLPIS